MNRLAWLALALLPACYASHEIERAPCDDVGPSRCGDELPVLCVDRLASELTVAAGCASLVVRGAGAFPERPERLQRVQLSRLVEGPGAVLIRTEVLAIEGASRAQAGQLFAEGCTCDGGGVSTDRAEVGHVFEGSGPVDVICLRNPDVLYRVTICALDDSAL
jgi:hypothetical protein